MRNKILEGHGSEKEVDILNETISNTEAEINRNKIMKHFKSFSDNPDKLNLGQVWKTRNKCGESLPTAKKGEDYIGSK